MNYEYIEIPTEVRKWINRLPGYNGIDVRVNTFTNQERWLLGRTDAQIWDYAKSNPLWTCPLFTRASLTDCKLNCDEKCDSRKCWEMFKNWALTPLGSKNPVINNQAEVYE